MIASLQAERDEALKHWTLYFDECIEAEARLKPLQRKLDQYGEWLRKCLDVLDDIGPADWLAEMRKGMGE